MLRYNGTIRVEVLENSGKYIIGGNIYGHVVDLPETKPELYIRGQPDDALRGFFAKQNGTKGGPLKARIYVPYHRDWWQAEIDLKDMTLGNPARILLTSTDTPIVRLC